MKYVPVDQVEPGQILGKTIYSSNGNVLLSKDVHLTVFMINTLRRIGVTAIYIQDEHFADIEIVDIVSEETKQMVIKQMSDTFETVNSGKQFSSKAVSISIDKLLQDIMRNNDVLLQLSDIRTEDNQMYIHALNVAVISILIGINLDLNQIQLKELATGALFHDIGKVGAYEDDPKNLKRHHTWRGFESLKNKREYSLLVAHVAFQHHEHVDGTGIPRGLQAEQIHLYAKIVCVASVYDNFLSDFTNGEGVMPHVAVERMMAMTGTILDHNVMIHFLKTVSIYPTGSSVRLSSRETGVVVGQHRGLPGRPIVRIVRRTTDPNDELDIKEVDLAKETTLFVETVLN